MSETSPQPSKDEPSGSVELFVSDPWTRFDFWAQRAWEAASLAMEVAQPDLWAVNNNNLDTRLLAAFNAASLAKELAAMSRPGVSSNDWTDGDDDEDVPEFFIAMIPDEDGQE